jgi:hypothetical protein
MGFERREYEHGRRALKSYGSASGAAAALREVSPVFSLRDATFINRNPVA